MNSKWYISTLILLLTLLGGVANQQQAQIPNQEIVLQFSQSDVTDEQTDEAITFVKKQLLRIGVETLLISEQVEGTLTITYYSETDVSSIKKILSKEQVLDIGFSIPENDKPLKIPSEKTSIAYNLDVFEIQDGNNSLSGLGGKLAIEIKSETIRFINPNVSILKSDIVLEESESSIKVNFKFQNYIALAIDNSSKKIPEVRAGPAV